MAGISPTNLYHDYLEIIHPFYEVAILGIDFLKTTVELIQLGWFEKEHGRTLTLSDVK